MIDRISWLYSFVFSLYTGSNMEKQSIGNRSVLELVDFLSEWRDLAPKDLQAEADSLITSYDDGQNQDLAELAEFVEDFAWRIWPVRFAMEEFFSEQGALVEWDRVSAAVRRSTAHLMQRFKQSAGCQKLDEMLRHDDYELTFKEAETREIEDVRHQARVDYWRSHPETFSVLTAEGENLREGYKRILDELEEIVQTSAGSLSEEARAKMTSLKDRIVYRGEHVPLETMEEELIYYRERKELPIDE